MLVVDDRTGIGVEGAAATLVRLADGEPMSSEEGQGTWGPLSGGAYRLALEAPGYLPHQQEIMIPHDGRFDPFRRRLVEVRGHVLLAFGRALRRLGVRFRWGAETPSEAMARCPEVSGDWGDALGELHQETETLWVADRDAVREDAERADALLARVEERL